MPPFSYIAQFHSSRSTPVIYRGSFKNHPINVKVAHLSIVGSLIRPNMNRHKIFNLKYSYFPCRPLTFDLPLNTSIRGF